jgi:hypothetical protein
MQPAAVCRRIILPVLELVGVHLLLDQLVRACHRLLELVIGAVVGLRFTSVLRAIRLIMDSDAVLVLSRARRPPLAGWDVLCEETFARQKADWLRYRAAR